VGRKTSDVQADVSPKKSGGMKKLLFMLAVGALVGYYLGFRLDEEKRSRLAKLLFEGREMWFRIFV
jgi:hypothetical protein